MVSMKRLFCSESVMDRKVFFTCLLYFSDFLRVSASRNEAERSELEGLRSDLEVAIEKFLSADYFDEPCNLIELLFAEDPQTQVIFDRDKCLIGYCLDKNIKVLFNNATVVNTLQNVFQFYPSRTEHHIGGFKYPIYHRFCPRNMNILGIISKVLVLFLIGAVSFQYGSSHGSDYSSKVNAWSSVEVALVVVFSSVLIHEVGELVDLKWNIAGYFSDSWNAFDTSSSLLGLLWLIARIGSSNLALIRVSLALQAIPEAIGLLRFLSINQVLGELVIMIQAMMWELVYFIVIYLVSLFGFCVCLRGLFYGEADYSSNSTTALTVFSVAFGNFDFSFGSSNLAVNVIGTILIVIIIVLSSVLLLNLLIAQMTNSYQKVKDQSFREWAFCYATIVRQCVLRNDMNVTTMLPAPLNLIPIMLSIPHYLIIYRTSLDNESPKCISLAGTVVNYLFAILHSPLYHFRSLQVFLQSFVKESENVNIFLMVKIFFGVILYPILWIMLKLVMIYDEYRLGTFKFEHHGQQFNIKRDWNAILFDSMETDNHKIQWKHASKKENIAVLGDETVKLQQNSMYYPLPQQQDTKSPAEYVFEPLVCVLYAKVSLTSLDIAGQTSVAFIGTEIASTKTEITSMLVSIDEKMNKKLESVNEKVSSLESKLDLVLTILQQNR